MSDIETHSEYLHRYVDGDLSEVEQGVLFRALSSDARLQQEFGEALLVRATALNEARKLVVPAALTSRLFMTAGVGLSSSKSPSTFGLGKLMSYAGVLVLGFMLSYLPDLAEPEESEGIVRSAAQFVDQSPKSEIFGSAERVAAPTVRSKGSTNSISSTLSLRDPIESIQAVPGETQRSFLSNEIPELTQEIAMASFHQRQFNLDVTKSALEHLVLIPAEYSDDANSELISIGITRSASILSSIVDQASGVSLLNDTRVSLFYQLDENQRIGAVLGNEATPVFVNRDDGSIAHRARLAWIGASYTRSMQSGSSGLIGTGSLLIGGSSSGPIGKLALGIEWNALDDIHFGLGLEGTRILLQNGGNWYGVSRLGITGGITYNFSNL